MSLAHRPSGPRHRPTVPSTTGPPRRFCGPDALVRAVAQPAAVATTAEPARRRRRAARRHEPDPSNDLVPRARTRGPGSLRRAPARTLTVVPGPDTDREVRAGRRAQIPGSAAKSSATARSMNFVSTSFAPPPAKCPQTPGMTRCSTVQPVIWDTAQASSSGGK